MLSTFLSKSGYYKFLTSIHNHVPQGFRIGAHTFDFVPKEASHIKSSMTMSAIVLDRPTTMFGAVFTKNKYPGAPVIVGKSRLSSNEYMQGIVINNKVSNVCSSSNGVLDAEEVCKSVGKPLNIEGNLFFPSSTGVIGWSLPLKEMLENSKSLVESLQSKSMLPLAEGIMTTDNYPKLRSVKVGKGRITAVAKGAGMIEPNMATMLSFILTDIKIDKDNLQTILQKAVDNSFNCISIDSDQSTSDMVILISSGMVDYDSRVDESIESMCKELSEDVVRNGEGVEHVIKVSIINAKTESQAKKIGKSIVNSPLFKCAIAGNDANVGRLVSAVGKCGETINIIKIGKYEIFKDNKFVLNDEIEKNLNQYLIETKMENKGFPAHNKCVNITIDVGQGDVEQTIIGSDLTHGYVDCNASYRS